MDRLPRGPVADPAPRRSEEPVPITGLLSYRLHRLANGLSRSAALRYRREFDVSLGEWRAIALLGAHPALTLNALARLAGIDKAQMSRIVTKLVDRGLVMRRCGAGRTTQLRLSRSGGDVYRGLITSANHRNQRVLARLSEHEAEVLDRVLDKLDAVSRELIREAESQDGAVAAGTDVPEAS